MALHFTEPALQGGFLIVDWRLRRLILPQASWRAEQVGWDLWITSVIRENSDIHAQRRAVDADLIEIPGLNTTYTYGTTGRLLEAWINEHFEYGPRSDGSPGQVCLWHNAVPIEQRDTDREGWHLHFQVPVTGLMVK
jgi:hypothetical protein